MAHRDLWAERARSFGQVADSYERARPGYPRAAVEWLLEDAPGRRLVELGAGTGKLTRLLLDMGCDVLAVEPLREMREVIERSLPAAQAREGSAEHIPAEDTWADAVLAAQAFHWFDGPRALAEIARVLHPGGVLGLLWNVRDDRAGWVAELSTILGEGSGDGVEGPNDDLAPAWSALVAASGRFTPLERHQEEHVQELAAADLVHRVRSMSWVATRPADVRERLLEEVAQLVRRHPDLRGRERFSLPYLTVAYRARRLD
jgi:SAM-dependent methyltransferase